jgi:alkylhydroperoxidase family enzyme
MAWIDDTPEDTPELAELLRRVSDPVTGAVDHIMRIHARHPAGLAAHYELYRAVMRGTRSLRAVDRELVALVVSKLNACHY